MRRDTVVLVETDDETLEATLRALIQHEGHRVVTARVGTSIGGENNASPTAAVILDLSNRQGLDVLVRLRACSEAAVAIIVVATDSSEEAVADAFDHGADDYLTKPLRLRELAARLRRALRRTNGARGTAPAPFRTGDLVVDLYTRTVTRGGAPVHLTGREYAILATLVRHKGAAVSVKDLVSNVRDDAPVDPRRYLSDCIANMRRKLEPTPEAPRYLLTVPGVGYRLGLAESSAAAHGLVER